MRIGVPKEIKNQEYRVGLLPGSVRELTTRGHEVLVETKAGDGIGFHDESYIQAGAKIASTAKEVFDNTDMIVKVKEPQPEECAMLHEGQILFTYLHLAADKVQTEGLIKSKCVAIAYETVTDDHGTLPLLTPMSEVAGRMAIQVGCWSLEKYQGGSGMLLGGVPGVQPAHVVVLGGGVVGLNALRMAIGLGAHVSVFDISLPRLRELNLLFGPKLETVYSTRQMIERYLAKADLVVGAVLSPGASAPKVVTKEMVKSMPEGSVFVDVAIDQGGCSETSKPTTHEKPTYVVDDVVHYCVTNMPGAVARTSASALNNATLPYVIKLAEKGYKAALQADHHLLNGLNIYRGDVVYKAVADSLGYEYVSPGEVLTGDVI